MIILRDKFPWKKKHNTHFLIVSSYIDYRRSTAQKASGPFFSYKAHHLLLLCVCFNSIALYMDSVKVIHHSMQSTQNIELQILYSIFFYIPLFDFIKMVSVSNIYKQ